MIEYNCNETELLFKFTVAIFIINENSENLKKAEDVKMQSIMNNFMYVLYNVLRKEKSLITIKKIFKDT